MEYNDIVDPSTGKQVEGYIFKDNTSCKLSIVNVNALSKPIEIMNYYYRDYDGHLIKLLNMENKIESASNYQIIPVHTYNLLKNANRLKDRLFVLECRYEVVNDNIKDIFKNATTSSEINTNMLSSIDFYVDDEGRCIERKKSKIFFQLVNEDYFDEYKEKIKKKKSDVVKMK